MKIEAIAITLGIISTIGGGGVWIHSHAEDKVLSGDLQIKNLSLMNTAQIQLISIKGDLRRLVDKPVDKRDEWDKMQIEYLKDQQSKWSAQALKLQGSPE
jgi:hypothetical protein